MPDPGGYDLTRFNIRDMARCGIAIRGLAEASASLEHLASAVTRHLQDELVGEDGSTQCALVRFFKTHPYNALEDHLKAYAALRLDRPPWDAMKCLTLLGTAGKLEAWNHRRRSDGHQAIPLPSEELVRQSPMISRLILEMGLEPGRLIDPDQHLLLEYRAEPHSVFYVPKAEGSPYVPAQAFVREHGIESVLGFGGLVPPNDLIVVILFSRVPIPPDTARRFSSVAVSVRLAAMRFIPDRIFAPGPMPEQPAALSEVIREWEPERLRRYCLVQQEVLTATERAVFEQSDELLRTLQRLESSNAELAQFAYVASHDLQSPLRTIASYLQLIQQRYEGRLDEKADKFMRYAVDGARRMQRLIDDLLSFSRVGSQSLEVRRLQLESAARAAWGMIRSDVEACDGQLEVEEGVWVLGDERQLEQLFLNLFQNALKFRSGDPPRVSVRARRVGTRLVVGVQDNGIGVDPRFSERVFDIFQRLHPKDQYPGSGIGLAVARRIVERHGGRIWVEPAEERGSVFHFTLRASDLEEEHGIGTSDE